MKRDIKKGVDIQAKADMAHTEKMADGLEKHAAVLDGIGKTQEKMYTTIGTVLHDMEKMEARIMYGFNYDESPNDLGTNERMAVCAAVYAMLEEDEKPSDAQREFLLVLEGCLGVSNRISGYDYSQLENVDSHADRMVILDILCSFLFLHQIDFSFFENEKYAWLKSLAVEKEITRACSKIEKEYGTVGIDGIVYRYKKTPDTENANAAEQSADSVDNTVEADEPKKASAEEESSLDIDQDQFEALRKIIVSYVSDESSFGKSVNQSPESAFREIQKSFRMLNPITCIAISKTGNGYILFSTHAFYFKGKTPNGNRYIRIPYKSIKIDSIAMELGKEKNTRKLNIPYYNKAGVLKTVSIDDTKVQEEKLRELLCEILNSGCIIADNDFSIDMPELDEAIQCHFFSALGMVLDSQGLGMAELYLLMRDYEFTKHWNKLATGFMNHALFYSEISAFANGIPYPSEERIAQQAVYLVLQTICRTNHIEGREASLLSSETEQLVKRFSKQKLTQKEFNSVLDYASKNLRSPSAEDLGDLQLRLVPNAVYASSIKDGAEAIADELSRVVNEKKKSVGDTLKEATKAIPNPSEIRDGAGKVINAIKKASTKETLRIPEKYKAIKQKLPKEMNVPQNAKAYSMRTGNASAILVNYPVSAEQAMPFDNPNELIDMLHETMDENEGIIEVKCGLTNAGSPYVYEIIKHRLHDNTGVSSTVEYTVNINVKQSKMIQFINGSFVEEGTTGMRETSVLALFQMVKKEKGNDDMEGWCRDPYEPSFKNGFLMNAAEIESLDERFPWHPLSEARSLIKYIIESN